MPRAKCRCGQALTVPDDGSDRVVCPKCGARVRVRRQASAAVVGDGYIRFTCPCGRPLKVDAATPPAQGKCPDCGRVVPVPAASERTLPPGHPETPTVDLDDADRELLERWAQSHRKRASAVAASPVRPPADVPPHPASSSEVGLRVCPRCGKPVPLGAVVCRACGGPVPRR